MTFKVNYGLERAERNRAKQARKDAKREKKAQGEPADDNADEPAAIHPPAASDPEQP
jgi:hypothetical protein